MIGVYSSRHDKIRRIKQESDYRKIAKNLLEYYAESGSLDNILSLLENKTFEILTPRDLLDHVSLLLESSNLKIKETFLDSDTQKIQISLVEAKKEELQKVTNRLGFSVKCQVSQGVTTIFIETKNLKFTTPNETNPKKLATQFGTSYKKSLGLLESKGIKTPTKQPTKTCRMCCSVMLESNDTHKCKSCGYEDTNPKLVEHRCDCYYCGGTLKENVCTDCKWVYKKEIVETVVAANTAPGVMTQTQSSVHPGACPCGGSVLFIGDGFRCLTCDKTLTKNDLGDFVQDKKESKESTNFVLSPMVESTVFFRQNRQAIIFEDQVASAPDQNYLLVVKDQEKLSEAYEYMLSQGYIGTSPIYQQTEQGWQPFDGVPTSSFVLACETSELANQIHNDLMTQGYDSEVASRIEAKRESEEPKNQSDAEHCEDGEVSGYDGKTVYKFDSFEQAQEFAQKGDNDLGREQEVIQGNDGKYWVTTPEIARELRKEINAKVLKKDPEKEQEEDHLPNDYSGEYTGKPDVDTSDDDLRLKKEKMSYYKDKSGGYGGQQSTFDYQHAFPESKNVDDFGMPFTDDNISISNKVESEIGDVNDILRQNLNAPKSNLKQVNEKLKQSGFNPITEGKLQVILHLGSKRASVAEIVGKTGLQEAIVKAILGN